MAYCRLDFITLRDSSAGGHPPAGAAAAGGGRWDAAMIMYRVMRVVYKSRGYIYIIIQITRLYVYKPYDYVDKHPRGPRGAGRARASTGGCCSGRRTARRWRACASAPSTPRSPSSSTRSGEERRGGWVFHTHTACAHTRRASRCRCVIYQRDTYQVS